KPLLEANVCASLAGLEAMQGTFDEARAHALHAEEIFAELGLVLGQAGVQQVAGEIELLAGEPAEAEQILRPSLDLLMERIGAPGYTGILFARTLYDQGRYEESADMLALVEPSIRHRELAQQSVFRSLQARLAGREGDPDAVALAELGVDLAKSTDATNQQAG